MNDRLQHGQHVIATYGEASTLKLPKVERDRSNGLPAARVVRTWNVRPDGDTLTAECVIPADMSLAAFATSLVDGASRGVWNGVHHALHQEPSIPNERFLPVSREGQQFNYELASSASHRSSFSPPANKSVTFWCEAYYATQKRSPGMSGPRASLDFDIVCTCSSTNGYVWTCTMAFEGFALDFGVEESDWDRWVDCDDIGCGGGSGPSGDWISLGVDVAELPYGGQVTVFDATSNGSITGWSYQPSHGGSAWDPGCAGATCSLMLENSGTMTVYGPGYTSDYVDITVDPCDPQTQTNCLLPLREDDIVKVGASVDSSFLRQDVPDSVKNVCVTLFNAFKSDWVNNRGAIQRGNPDLPDSTVKPHDAAYGDGIWHIDQDWLDQVVIGNSGHSKVLLSLMLHEAAHKLQYPTHGDPSGAGVYTEWPYSITRPDTSGSPVPSCVFR